MFVDQTICKLAKYPDPALAEQRSNTTWLDDDELHCYFEDLHWHDQVCIELSLNNGTTFTDNC